MTCSLYAILMPCAYCRRYGGTCYLWVRDWRGVRWLTSQHLLICARKCRLGVGCLYSIEYYSIGVLCYCIMLCYVILCHSAYFILNSFILGWEQVDDANEWKLPDLRMITLGNLKPLSATFGRHSGQGLRLIKSASGFVNTDMQTFRMVGVDEHQQLFFKWKEIETFYSMDAIQVGIQGSVLHVMGGSSLVELSIVALHATKLSIEKCVNLKALKVMCPLVEDVALASCPSITRE